MEAQSTQPTSNSKQANDPSQPSPEDSQPRPRDAHLIHALLAAQGVSAYQGRVPLMLADFAYRYTRSVLSDASTLTAEGYGSRGPATGRGAHNASEEINAESLRLAVQARHAAQMPVELPKETLVDMATEMNRLALPKIEKDFGLRLPPEQHLLTGVGFGLQERWEVEIEAAEAEAEAAAAAERGKQDGTAMEVDEGEGGILDGEEMDTEEFEEVMGVTAKTLT